MLTPHEASKPKSLMLDRIDTPVGETLLLTDETGALRALDFSDYEGRMHTLMRRHYGAMTFQIGRAPDRVRNAVERYFSGEMGAFQGLIWKTNGTLFQRRVWTSLCAIRPGETQSYKELAARVGSPRAMRAVGLANGANPVAIVVPCHRVIGANGRLTGYGGGLPRKAWLLAHEGATVPFPT
jgi:methylated-DNA-[protein]-cysteine S-methyltransferase